MNCYRETRVLNRKELQSYVAQKNFFSSIIRQHLRRENKERRQKHGCDFHADIDKLVAGEETETEK